MQRQTERKRNTRRWARHRWFATVVPPAFIFGLLIFAGMVVSQAEDKSVREYWVPGHGVLALTVPISWREQTHQPLKKLPPTITFHPQEGEDFKVTVTALWGQRGDRNFNSADKVRALVESDREGVAPNAVESELVVQAITGDYARGYYFVATDKASRPGDPPCLFRAAVATGDLLLNVTALSHQKDSEAIQEVLLMLQDASQLDE